MSLLEAIRDAVRRLPEKKQEEVLRYVLSLREPSSSREAETGWISRNRAAYIGQWVAVEGDRLILGGP